jgi:hypothetical protein
VRPLTVDLNAQESRPYFLWDEDISVGELRQVLRAGSGYERVRLVGKMLREARDVDVWEFMTPAEVAEMLPKLGRRLGRRAGRLGRSRLALTIDHKPRTARF